MINQNRINNVGTFVRVNKMDKTKESAVAKDEHKLKSKPHLQST